MFPFFLLFICIFITNGYETCGDINIYSFGNPLNADFLGQYTQQAQMTDKRHVFSIISSRSDKSLKLWWTHFRTRVSRWSIGPIVGDESSVIAYKDSHALHPSEIARQRSLWRVYHNGKWKVDASLHIKCNDAISAFEWKQDCMVLGVTNVAIDSRKSHAMDTLDYLKVSGYGLTAKYHSTSTGFHIEYDATHWNILDQDGSITASAQSDAIFPNNLNKHETKWILDDNKISQFMSVHCEVREKQYYYKSLRENFQVCTENTVFGKFNNAHFDTVVLKDVDEWSFGITDDLKYFIWNETANEAIHRIPSVGIGTAGISNDEDVIKWAINEYGYERIDSASDHAPWYENEYIIGNLLKNGILNRDRFLVTTKLYAKDQGFYGAKHGLDDSLSALNVDYIDIYLIHHPHCDNTLCDGSWKTSWRVIEDYYFENKIKYVGVSNFDMNQFHELLDWSNIPVSVIQNWFDPFRQNDRNILEECKRLSIVYEAYSLLGTQWKYIASGYKGNKDPVFSNAKLKKIAQTYPDKSIAQIVLRWALQNHIAVLPSSSKQHRIKENMEIFDFQLNETDIIAIDSLK